MDRTRGIGGSDVAAIMGISPWKTAYDVYCEKIGQESPVKIDAKRQLAMDVGTHMESFIADLYARHKNVVLETMDEYAHPAFPHRLIHIDRLIKDGGILECKTASAFTTKEWGKPDSDTYPLHYRYQVSYYCAVLNAPYADIAVLIGNNDFRNYRYERNYTLEESILQSVDSFWHNHVLKGCPPEPITRVPFKKEKIKTTDDILLYEVNNGDKIKSLRQTNETIKYYQDLADNIKKDIILDMKDEEYILSPSGDKIVSYCNQVRRSFDTDRFKSEHSEMYHSYLKESQNKVFRLF